MASSHPLPRLAPIMAALAFAGLVPAALANSVPLLDEPVPAAGAVQRVKPEIPCGKVILLPLTATDADGDPLTYTVKSSNAHIHARVKTGNPFLKLSVNYPGDGASVPAFAGDLFFQLFRDWTPSTSRIIGGLAQAGFYDGLKFHRIADLSADPTVENNFIVQGGDPLGNGMGGPGFRHENEFHPGAIFSGRGQLAIANSGYRLDGFAGGVFVPGDWTGTNGSQFFITDSQLRELDFKHTIFGQLTRGWEIFDKIVDVPRHPASTTNGAPAKDSPTAPLTITSATLLPNSHDAVLVLSATNVGTSSITVTVSDSKGGQATRVFTATAIADEWNSRPFVVPPGNAVGPKDRPFRVNVGAVDLEHDYTFRNSQLVDGSETNAVENQDGSFAGKPGFTGPIRIGLSVSEYDMTHRGAIDGAGPQIENRASMVVGISDKVVVGDPVQIPAAPDAAADGVVVARIRDADGRGSAADFTAKINWGDGTPSTDGTVVRDTSRPGSAFYAVTGSHTYSRPGNFRVAVEIFGSKGARTLVQSEAIVSAAPLKAAGVEIDAAGVALANRILATFTDADSTKLASDYEARIDWGNGTVTPGKVKAGNGGFSVLGSHKYLDPERYSVLVTVQKRGTAESATAWSTVNLRGASAKPHLPPFPQAHLICAWEQGPARTLQGQGATLQANFEGSFLIINPGSKISPQAKLRFWLSKDKALNKSGADADLPMKIGALPEAAIAPLKPGGGVRYILKANGGSDLRLKPAKGETGGGLNILAELDYKDPITDNSAVSKIGLFGPINAILVESASGLMTSETGTTASFTVRLEKEPTAPVSIVVSVSDPTEGSIEAPAVTPGTNIRKLEFDATNFATPQTVTVKGVDDTLGDGDISYEVRLAAAVSEDIRYSGMTAPAVEVKNLDNESGIRVTSAPSLVTTEAGGQAQFNVRLDRRPSSDVVIALESSDASEGTVAPVSLTFTPVNWNINRVVTIAGVDDAEVDGDVAYSIILKPAVSSDPGFNGKTGPQVSVTNNDNDTAP